VDLKTRLSSRKFWFALLGSVLPLVAQALTGEVGWGQAVSASAAIIIGYVFGQSYVDGKRVEGVPPPALPAAPPDSPPV